MWSSPAIARTADELMPPSAGIELLRIVQLIGYRLLYNPVGLFVAYGMPLRRALARGNLLRAVGDEPFARAYPDAGRRRRGVQRGGRQILPR